MAREFLMAVKESAFKTPMVSPVIWTTATSFGLVNADAYYVRLDGGNAFKMRSRPSGKVTVPYGGGVAIPAYVVSDKQEIKGSLTMKLTVKTAPFWLSWAGVRISGGTAPWTTSEPNGDLASVAIYHAKTYSDGSIKRNVYLGCKVDTWALSVSEASTVATLELGISAALMQGNQFDSSADPDATIFPPPADAAYAIDPYLFIHAGGSSFVTLGGTVRTEFTELAINSANVLARRYYPNRYIQLLRFMGRTTTCATKLLYKSGSPDDRAHYEGLISEACSIELGDGTHSVIMDMKAQNVWDPFEDDLPLDDLYMFSATSGNMYDTSAGKDFSLAFA